MKFLALISIILLAGGYIALIPIILILAYKEAEKGHIIIASILIIALAISA